MDKIDIGKKFKCTPGDMLPFGVKRVSDGVQFAVSMPPGKKFFLNLYLRGRKKPACRIPLSREYRRGSVYFVKVTDCPGASQSRSVADILSRDYEYMYEVDGEEFVDPYATVITGREHWGRRSGKIPGIRGGISLEEFDWQGDSPLFMSYSDMILYQLHVRGFTRHPSSGVSARGTFAGLQEKIPYLQELGVNALLLLPCYEFDEIQSEQESAVGQPTEVKNQSKESKTKLNYWGYGGGQTYYFAPKASYSSDGASASQEFKCLVRSLHQAGIEILLDIYFMPGTNACTMEDCLRNWVLEYHVDGFRVNQEIMPSAVLASDPVLSGVKLLADYWDPDMLRSVRASRGQSALAEYNEGFLTTARRYLKSDEGQVENFAGCFCHGMSCHGESDVNRINYITSVNGFTMMDLVSYDVKHNEANGEENRDGTQYNYSWNCGVEGRSRKKAIVSRRMCQIRNAFAMMLLAQGTPMLLAGDEFGNSQQGNNNPYCQDNGITWLDWHQLQSHRDIFEYVQRLIAFRRIHPVLRQPAPLKMFDTLSCGMPDLSIHGTQAWRTDFSYYSRMLAFLLYGEYQRRGDGTADDSLYIIFNMHWESQSFDLPHLPGAREWHPVIETYGGIFNEPPKPSRLGGRKKKPIMVRQRKTIVPPRSLVVFVGR